MVKTGLPRYKAISVPKTALFFNLLFLFYIYLFTPVAQGCNSRCNMQQIFEIKKIYNKINKFYLLQKGWRVALCNSEDGRPEATSLLAKPMQLIL
jgi:hypothetical protein